MEENYGGDTQKKRKAEEVGAQPFKKVVPLVDLPNESRLEIAGRKIMAFLTEFDDPSKYADVKNYTVARKLLEQIIKDTREYELYRVQLEDATEQIVRLQKEGTDTRLAKMIPNIRVTIAEYSSVQKSVASIIQKNGAEVLLLSRKSPKEQKDSMDVDDVNLSKTEQAVANSPIACNLDDGVFRIPKSDKLSSNGITAGLLRVFMLVQKDLAKIKDLPISFQEIKEKDMDILDPEVPIISTLISILFKIGRNDSFDEKDLKDNPVAVQFLDGIIRGIMSKLGVNDVVPKRADKQVRYYYLTLFTSRTVGQTVTSKLGTAIVNRLFSLTHQYILSMRDDMKKLVLTVPSLSNQLIFDPKLFKTLDILSLRQYRKYCFKEEYSLLETKFALDRELPIRNKLSSVVSRRDYSALVDRYNHNHTYRISGYDGLKAILDSRARLIKDQMIQRQRNKRLGPEGTCLQDLLKSSKEDFNILYSTYNPLGFQLVVLLFPIKSEEVKYFSYLDNEGNIKIDPTAITDWWGRTPSDSSIKSKLAQNFGITEIRHLNEFLMRTFLRLASIVRFLVGT